jgi:hypothetical protein
MVSRMIVVLLSLDCLAVQPALARVLSFVSVREHHVLRQDAWVKLCHCSRAVTFTVRAGTHVFAISVSHVFSF